MAFGKAAHGLADPVEAQRQGHNVGVIEAAAAALAQQHVDLALDLLFLGARLHKRGERQRGVRAGQQLVERFDRGQHFQGSRLQQNRETILPDK